MRYHRKNYGRFTPRSFQHPIVKKVIYVGLLGYLIRFLDMAILHKCRNMISVILNQGIRSGSYQANF